MTMEQRKSEATEKAKGENERKPKLDPEEQKKARQEESLNADITYEVVRKEGEKELSRPLQALLWAAIAGGMSMGFSFVTEAILRAHLPDAEWRPLITKLGYPVGFLIITLGSQQLFTENTITPIVPLLVKRTGEVFRKVTALWVVVFLGNIAGAIAFAMMIGLTAAFEPKIHTAFTAIAEEALRGSFATIFIKGVFAGWLIALMVWMLPAGKREKFPTILLMTYLVGIGGLSHIIVGSVEVLYLVVTGQASVMTYVTDFMTPTLLGNVAGGLVLVTGLNHAQVAPGAKQNQ